MKILIPALLVLLSPAAAAAQAELQLRRVAENVYAALQPAERRFDDSNSTIVVLPDGVLVVDTQNSPTGARAVIEAVRSLTDLPVRWVVNTHWHGDHVQGNQAWRDSFPGVEFIAHATTAEDIEDRARTALQEDLEAIPAWLAAAREALAAGEADGRPLSDTERELLSGRIARREAYLERARAVTEFVLPTRTVEDTLTLGGGPTVRILHFAGHTRGDLVLFLPAEKVLVTGDLLDDLPFTGHGSPRELVRTLRSLETLDFEMVVPGHGSIRRGREHLRRVAGLFEFIVERVESAVRAGASLEEAGERVDPAAFRDWFVIDEVSARYWDFFVGEAVRRAWEEATGASAEGVR